jgi:GDP-D-mannose 3', 5'-epimerase
MIRVVVTGAGGFIGSHLVSYLRRAGYWVRGVDLKQPEFAPTEADEFLLLDLRDREQALHAFEGMQHAYSLAADMGGMGYISAHHAEILRNNSLINIHSLDAARRHGVQRYLFTSSACVYPEHLQEREDVTPLKEDDAYPAQPQDAYGWEKLIAERLCMHYGEEYGIATRVVRFHNIFGPKGTWQGGREKAPAALCRKIAIAKLSGQSEIEVWGDGEQTRSFCYIDDCIDGLYRLMSSSYDRPLNLGQDRLVTINQLVAMVSEIAGVQLSVRHIEGPQGVRGRNSDNSRLREILSWEPRITLEEGLTHTYGWIQEQVQSTMAIAAPIVAHV